MLVNGRKFKNQNHFKEMKLEEQFNVKNEWCNVVKDIKK